MILEALKKELEAQELVCSDLWEEYENTALNHPSWPQLWQNYLKESKKLSKIVSEIVEITRIEMGHSSSN